jgi:hypothetical protein
LHDLDNEPEAKVIVADKDLEMKMVTILIGDDLSAVVDFSFWDH